MFWRRLTAVVLCGVFGPGCGTSDVYVGTFRRCLCEADLDSIVRLDDDKSRLTLQLFRGREEDPLKGKMLFDGDVQILAVFDIDDGGYDPYPVKNLKLDGDQLKGKVDLPILYPPSIHFKGTFTHHHSLLVVDVDHLGKIALKRVEDEAKEDDEPEADTGP